MIENCLPQHCRRAFSDR